jgi:hypothetical protein
LTLHKSNILTLHESNILTLHESNILTLHESNILTLHESNILTLHSTQERGHIFVTVHCLSTAAANAAKLLATAKLPLPPLCCRAAAATPKLPATAKLPSAAKLLPSCRV